MQRAKARLRVTTHGYQAVLGVSMHGDKAAFGLSIQKVKVALGIGPRLHRIRASTGAVGLKQRWTRGGRYYHRPTHCQERSESGEGDEVTRADLDMPIYLD